LVREPKGQVINMVRCQVSQMASANIKGAFANL